MSQGFLTKQLDALTQQGIQTICSLTQIKGNLPVFPTSTVFSRTRLVEKDKKKKQRKEEKRSCLSHLNISTVQFRSCCKISEEKGKKLQSQLDI